MDLYNERWNEVWSEGLTDLSIELRMIASETGVVIGQEVRRKLELLGQCLRDLQTARDNYFEVGELLLSPSTAVSDRMTAVYRVGGLYERKTRIDLEPEKIKNARAVIHSMDKEDEFGKNVDSIVGAIESSVLPFLKLKLH
jgi:predicted RNA-binding protein with EMAP domain